MNVIPSLPATQVARTALVPQLTRRARDGEEGRGAGGTPATVALSAAGIAFEVPATSTTRAPTSYGLEAAEALDVDPARVFKTLLAPSTARSSSGSSRSRASSTSRRWPAPSAAARR